MNYDLLKGCLCWFWNNKESDLKLGVLADYYQDDECPEMLTFYELNGNCFKHCEPAKYKDVQFYDENPMKYCYLSALEKAEQKIIDAIHEYFKDVMPDYEHMPNSAVAMYDNKEHCACSESDEVVNAIGEYMELL